MATESLLEPLLDLITSSVKAMKEELAQAKLSEPWLSKAEFHPWDLELPPVTYWNARRNLIASLGMMTVSQPTPLTVLLRLRFSPSSTTIGSRSESQGEDHLRCYKCTSSIMTRPTVPTFIDALDLHIYSINIQQP